MYELGICYEYGLGTKKDKVKALECYKNAADNGSSLIQNKV